MNLKKPLSKLALGLIAVSAINISFAAGFIEDSKASIQFRNFYFNDDFRDDANDRREWAQGFIFKFESGYTEGDVGFGLDAMGLWGIRLDSSKKHANTGLMPVHDNGKAAKQAASYGLAAKMKILDYAKVVSGTQLFKTPLLNSNDGRLLPQTFRGTRLELTPIKNLDFDAAYLTKFKMRNETHSEKIYGQGYKGSEGSHFWYAGTNYKPIDQLKLSYYYGELKDFYRQQYLGLNHKFDLPKGKLTTDARYFMSRKEGEARIGNVDNDMLSLWLTYQLDNQSFGLGYQKLNGPTTFPYVAGTSIHSFSNAGVAKFINPHEQTWMLRYDFNFKSWGLPGLNLMTRYYKASNKGYKDNTQKEWERDTNLSYSFQSKPLKGLKVEARNSKYRTDYKTSGRDNVRFYLTYTLDLK